MGSANPKELSFTRSTLLDFGHPQYKLETSLGKHLFPKYLYNCAQLDIESSFTV